MCGLGDLRDPDVIVEAVAEAAYFRRSTIAVIGGVAKTRIRSCHSVSKIR